LSLAVDAELKVFHKISLITLSIAQRQRYVSLY
jgi:hypothetical protein